MKWRDLRIVVVTHVFATGPAQELESYLIKQEARTILFIGHPFSYCEDTRSFLRRYERGELVLERKASVWRLRGVLMYLKDVLYTWLWVLSCKDSFDLYVGADCLNAFAGVWLRRAGKVKQVVLYTIDYVPHRFSNRILNEIYHWTDKFCLQHCDQVWNLSPRMAEGRERMRGLRRNDYAPQVVVPHGCHFDRIKRLPFEEIDRNALVFMGHLLEKQGVQLAIRALPHIRCAVPGAWLLVTGTGPYEQQLKALATDLGLEDGVQFTGYVEDHQEIEERLARCALALALYNPEIDTFSYYADPGKVKTYLAAGLPVILTDVPYIARELEARRCGLVVRYDSVEDLTEAVIWLLTDKDRLREYKENAIRLAADYDWSRVFDNAMRSVLGRAWTDAC